MALEKSAQEQKIPRALYMPANMQPVKVRLGAWEQEHLEGTDGLPASATQEGELSER